MGNSKADRLRRYESAVLRQVKLVAGDKHRYAPVEEFLRKGHTIKVGEDDCQYVAEENGRIVFWLERR